MIFATPRRSFVTSTSSFVADPAEEQKTWETKEKEKSRAAVQHSAATTHKKHVMQRLVLQRALQRQSRVAFRPLASTSTLFSARPLSTTKDNTPVGGKLSNEGSHSDFQKQSKVPESSEFDAQVWLADVVKQHRILLFMKGSPENPRCGFSSTVVQILNSYDVPFASADVLENEDIRAGLKQFSNWPTFPQLYVDGEFIGGCDILKEMHSKNELEDLLQPKK